MIPLFNKFTSGVSEIRKQPTGEICIRIGRQIRRGNHPAWVRFRKEESRLRSSNSWPQIAIPAHELTMKRKIGFCSIVPWVAHVSNRKQLPFKIAGGQKILRSPDRKEGLADIMRTSSRIKEFKLSDAIIYSHIRDGRFLLLVCLLLGFALWWYLAPEQLLVKPGALAAPDIGVLVQVCRDTFIHHICSIHHVPSPCDHCNEPLNKEARILFENKDCFDPLQIDNQSRVRAFAVFVAAIVISLALTESVSVNGVRWK